MDSLFISIDYLGTIALAITGASIAAKIRMDLFGLGFLAFITAVGGGTMRDIILNQPVFWTLNPVYIYIIVLVTPLVFLIRSKIERITKILFFIDTLGLGFYAIVGTQKSLILGFNYPVAILMGITSGVLGGIIRSLFSQEVSILYKKELYATVAACASSLYLVLKIYDVNEFLAVIITLLVSSLARYMAVKYKITLPST
tara:strand:+ start:3479 stop:4078 length:600 start_codon:yes stop_codon:yes gene_type:complete